MQGWPPVLGLAACGGSILQVGEWHTHLPTPPPALTLHCTGMLSPMGNKSKCFLIHSPKFSDDDVSGFWGGIGGMEEATFEAVSQQDDGKSLLLEPGELTSWRGDTTHQLERRETARVGLGSTTIRQLARPTLQPAHHSRYTASSRFLYSSSSSEYSDHRILHKQALEKRLEGRGRESS